MSKAVALILILSLMLVLASCGSPAASTTTACTEITVSTADATTLTTDNATNNDRTNGENLVVNNSFALGNIRLSLRPGTKVERIGENLYLLTITKNKASAVLFISDVSQIDISPIPLLLKNQHESITEDTSERIGLQQLDLQVCGFDTIADSYTCISEDKIISAHLDISFTDSRFIYTFRYVAFPADEEESYDLSFKFGQILGAATYIGEAPLDVQSTAPYTTGTEPENDSDPATADKANALKSAKDYLRVMPFSYTGLIDQLEYEGYSTTAATYAADNCGADWNEQALKSAKSYLDLSAFSYSGLISQLEYEGFTTVEATYGADKCGADWNEQAAKSAKSYLDMMEFSRAELIDQLEFEGFTRDQAEYGVSASGLE